MYHILIAADVLVASGATLHLLLHYRRATTAVAWLFALWVFPLLGSLLYATLAVYDAPRAVRKRKARATAIRTADRREVCPASVRAAQAGDPVFAGLVDRATPFPLTGGNSVEILPSGAAAFDAMLDAIAGAQREVCLLTYGLEAGRVAQRLRERLVDRVRAGATVRVLYDRLGSFDLPRAFVESLRDDGVRVAGFLRPNPLKRRLQINFRNHRKLLVVDRAVAFTGGINWADGYDERERSPRPLRDLHVRVKGPVVAAMRRVLLEDWCIAAEEPMPPTRPEDGCAAGPLPVRAIPHGPDEEGPGLFAVFSGAIHRARSEVFLVTPYFVPGGTMREALRVAALSGVKVKILLPRESDNPVADLAARAQFPPLLDAGAEILLAEGPFLHAKALVVDGAWSSVGSCNFDQRSFHCNYEFNLEVVGAEFARAVLRHFDGDLARAGRVDPVIFRRRSPWHRALQNAAALFEPLL